MKNNEITALVGGYLHRAKETGLAPYALTARGYWNVLGKMHKGLGTRESLKILNGRFVDAVAWAVQQDNFYCCGDRNRVYGTESGVVVKIPIEAVRERSGLIDKLRKGGWIK